MSAALPTGTPPVERNIDPIEHARLQRLVREHDENAQDMIIPPISTAQAEKHGRQLYRAVTMWDDIESAVNEDERRHSDPPPPPTMDETVRQIQNRRYNTYLALIDRITGFRDVLTDGSLTPADLRKYYKELLKGAHSGRTTDFYQICSVVGEWLSKTYEPFATRSRAGRGTKNTSTFALLTPITIDYNDSLCQRNMVGGAIPECALYTNFFCACFYNKRKTADNVDLGFLKARLLVIVWYSIFVSPTAAGYEDVESDDESESDTNNNEDDVGSQPQTDLEPPRKKARYAKPSKASKKNNAARSNMGSTVPPRSIAYAAVMLHMNLTNMKNWQDSKNGVSYPAMYEFIVDYLEFPSDAEMEEHVQGLLLWWNRQVFRNAPENGVMATTATSKELLAKQREARKKAAEDARATAALIEALQRPAPTEAERVAAEGRILLEAEKEKEREVQRVVDTQAEIARLTASINPSTAPV